MNSDYHKFKTKFNSELKNWLTQKQHNFSEKYNEDLVDELISQIKTLALKEGKRIRPFVAYLLCKEETENRELDWKPFVAIELFHLFGLIHDDIMDRDETRRGVETIHTFIEKKFDPPDNKHIGDSLAILAGDLVYSWVNELFFQAEGYPNNHISSAKEKFFFMSEEVMVGQIMDMDNRSDKDIEYLFKKMSLKTASYTFVRPMQIGLALGGGSKEKEEFCEQWGQKMGLAFQIQDNLLDFNSVDKQKDDFSDIKEGNVNIFTHFIKKNKPEEYNEILEPKLGADNLSETDKKKIKKLFLSSGAVEYAEAQINDYLEDSKKILKDSNLRAETKNSLANLINTLENRTK